MSSSPLIDQIAERTERLLLRHQELQRTNELLEQQVQALSTERDSLKSRLAAARSRMQALIERLHAAGVMTDEEAAPTQAEEPAPEEPAP